MLSLTKSSDYKVIAKIKAKDKDKLIYLVEDDTKPSEIKLTPQEKLKHFQKYLKNDKKLSVTDIQMMVRAYQDNQPADQLQSKLQRKYVDSIEHVSVSEKKHLHFDADVFPIIQDESYRMFISGLSGSGKSYFISMFLKHNPIRTKGAGVFLFSPVKDDKSLSSIKNLIHIDLLEIEDELKDELRLEHLPPGSILIFDDVESYDKKVRKLYTDFRDIALERGRHSKISTLTVSHNCMNGNSTKASIRESQYWILFRSNIRDFKNILKLYGGLETKKITELLDVKSRWMLFKKTMPQYVVFEHSVMII